MQARVPRAEDGPHAAPADKLLQQYVVELLAFERLTELPRIKHRRDGAHFVRR